jgi:PAS domain-containing protein
VKLEKSVKEERDKLHSIFETIPDSVYIVSEDYEIAFMNRAMIDEFGDHAGSIC